KPLGTQELVLGLQCQENGQELSPIALEPGPEPHRAKQEARNQKRAQGRGEVEADEQLCIPPLNPQTCLLGSEENLAPLAGEKAVPPGNDAVSPAMVRSRNPGKDDCAKEEMAVAADAATL
ncbi:USP19 isoform 13, partial [Pongo abelii]